MIQSIGKTIYELRKKNAMTQEQLAQLLHVSNVAVSKWENNNTYPDISLLKPLARCLKVTVDELLNFEVFLNEKEVLTLKTKLSVLFEDGSNDEAIKLAEQYLNEFPTDLHLKFQIASLYFRYASAGLNETFAHTQLKSAISLFEQSSHCENSTIQDASKYMLISLYSSTGDNDKALSLIDRMPVSMPSLKTMKSSILYQMDEIAEAMKLNQSCLWEDLNTIRLNLISLAKGYRKQKKYDEALNIVDRGLDLSKTFEIADIINIDINLYLFKIELLLSIGRRKEALEVFSIMTALYESYIVSPNKDHLLFGCIDFNLTMSKRFMMNNTLLLFEENDLFKAIEDELEYKRFIQLIKSNLS